MDDEKVYVGWKDILALSIAYIELFAPYAIIALSAIGVMMFLFSLS